MESKSFPSSTKRGFSNEIEDSPTAKRARRAKRHKKRHSSGEKDSSPFVKQEDWVPIDNNPNPTTPNNSTSGTNEYKCARSITPHPRKHGLDADVLESTEKDKEGATDLTALIDSKIQA